MHVNLDVEPETGYRGENFRECVCGSRIGDEDYASLCSFNDSLRTASPRINVQTAGPIVPTPDWEREVA